MKEQIKKYLDEQVQKNSALAGKYDAERLDKCIDYITEEARKYLNGSNGYVEDALVYKWARDYYLEVPSETKPLEEKKVEVKKAVVEKKETDENKKQLSLFEV